MTLSTKRKRPTRDEQAVGDNSQSLKRIAPGGMTRRTPLPDHEKSSQSGEAASRKPIILHLHQQSAVLAPVNPPVQQSGQVIHNENSDEMSRLSEFPSAAAVFHVYL